MLERQREGIAKAKAEGKYRGRAPTARAKADDVLTLLKNGVGPVEVARQLGIGRAPSIASSTRRRRNEAVDPQRLKIQGLADGGVSP